MHQKKRHPGNDYPFSALPISVIRLNEFEVTQADISIRLHDINLKRDKNLRDTKEIITASHTSCKRQI